MRQLVLLLLFSLVGCDTSGVDPVAFSETLLVRIENDTTLSLTTEGAPGCMTPMVVETHVRPRQLDVDVLGLRRIDGPTCLAMIPSTWATELPEFEGTLELAIGHNGATDLYAIRDTPEGRILDAVRTSATRPWPR